MEARRIFDAGGRIPRRFWEKARAGRLPVPGDLLELGLGLLGDSAGMAAAIVSGTRQETSFQEFQNKLHGLEWFGCVRTRARLRDNAPLAEWLQVAEVIPYDDRPWAAEGIGYESAESAWTAGDLGRPLRADLPRWPLIVMHTGMGMLAGRRLMEKVAKPGDMANALARFCDQCMTHSRPGYEGCAIEPIGLIASTLHQARIPEMDRVFSASAPQMREYLWHGIGRATYFLPFNMLPVGLSGLRAISQARQQAPDEVARQNAVAGAAWAFTLVNLRTPEVMALLLREHRDLVNDPAVRNGIRSALTIWKELQSGDPALAKLLEIVPPGLVPADAPANGFGAVFRYQPE
jgi:hypothetical protein